jgi:hypothetical protein
VNPFALREPDMLVKGGKIEWAQFFIYWSWQELTAMKSFERSEAEKYVAESHELLNDLSKEVPKK